VTKQGTLMRRSTVLFPPLKLEFLDHIELGAPVVWLATVVGKVTARGFKTRASVTRPWRVNKNRQHSFGLFKVYPTISVTPIIHIYLYFCHLKHLQLQMHKHFLNRISKNISETCAANLWLTMVLISFLIQCNNTSSWAHNTYLKCLDENSKNKLDMCCQLAADNRIDFSLMWCNNTSSWAHNKVCKCLYENSKTSLWHVPPTCDRQCHWFLSLCHMIICLHELILQFINVYIKIQKQFRYVLPTCGWQCHWFLS
jgi:hypothetical protein